MKEVNRLYFYILIVLSSLNFYNPFGIISDKMGKLLFYFICFISLIYAKKIGVNSKIVGYPKRAYKLLILGILISIIMGTLYHDQSLSVTFVATLPYLFGYLVFYILIKFNIPKGKILNAIWIFCFIGMGTYLINMIAIPNVIFGSEKDSFDMSRGIIRISIYSIELVILLFFYSINRWIIANKRKYLWLIFLTSVFIVLSVIRQYILLSFVLGLFFILKRVSLLKRIMVIAICLMIYLYVLPQIPIYNTMVQLSEKQAERNKLEEDDIRIRAWRFYIDEYQTNELTRILGNGVPSIGNSSWGNKFERTVSYEYGGNGCFYVDVGWAGFYWLFGSVATLGLIILLLKAIFKKKSESDQYLTCWCIFVVLTSVASAPILFYYQIVSIVTVLYLIYGKDDKNSNNYSKL